MEKPRASGDGMTETPQDDETAGRRHSHWVGQGSYGSGVRSQVFEVVVRQAMAGAPWEYICEGPMQVNRITREEVIEEVRRRQGGDDHPTAGVPRNPLPSAGSGTVSLTLPLPVATHDDDEKSQLDWV
jgi:hypothetical protein